jgi:hypothetical protein
MVESAREAVYGRFGGYARALTLSQDEKVTAAQRSASGQVLVVFGASAWAPASLARTIIETHSPQCRAALAGLDDDSRSSAINRLVAIALRTRGEQLRRVANARVGGSHSRPEARITIGLADNAKIFGTAVHEFIHALAHPAFEAAFIDERGIIEGFTEYFTRQVVSTERSEYRHVVEQASAVRGAMSGPFLLPMFGAAAEESMQLAYFKGRLELIGWQPSGPEELADVQKAGGSAQWRPDVARRYAAEYMAQAQAAQAASRNVLGVGLFFTRTGTETISVRYSRVLARTEPYARGQLVAEGQLLGSPREAGSAIGASLGVAAEYQEPWFYLAGGLRFVGGNVPSGDENRLDVSPFVGGGVRLWQVVRVGGEGFVLLPVQGPGFTYGAGLSVGVEF